MSTFIRIPKQEILASGNHCIVRKRDTDQLLGMFTPNEMLIHADNPYDPIPHKTRFRADGATLVDWKRFKTDMYSHNGRLITDCYMPVYLREEAAFLRVG